jgi:photosystem II stability/assembly factor-like uncharacterized protein
MLLVTPSERWLLGSGQDSPFDVLYVTRDAAHSWQKVSVPAPKEVFPATETDYHLPTFSDSRHGLLQVNYRGGIGVKPAAVLFATGDGGRTWKPDRMETEAYDSLNRGTPTVVDSAWVWVTVPDLGPKLITIGKGRRVDLCADTAKNLYPLSEVGQLNFVSPTQGWVIVGDGKLLSTTDGGATWTTLTPGPQPHVIPPPSGSFIPRQPSSQNANQR